MATLAIFALLALTIMTMGDAAAQFRGGFNRGGGLGGGGFSRGGFNRGGFDRGRMPRTMDRGPRFDRMPGTRFGTQSGGVHNPRFGRYPRAGRGDRLVRPPREGMRPSRVGTRRPGKIGTRLPGRRPPKVGEAHPPKGGVKRPPKVGDRHPPKVGDRRPPKVGDRHPPKHGDTRPPKGGDKRPPEVAERPPRGGDHRPPKDDCYRAASSSCRPDTRPPEKYPDDERPPRPPRRPPVVVVDLPPFTPPIPPAYDPPPPPPPPPAAGGGGSPPPRATPPRRPQPPQRSGRAFGGPPPTGEGRFVPNEVICVLRDDLTDAEIDQFLLDHSLARTQGGSIRMGLIGARVFRYRITDGASVQAKVAELQGDPRGVSVQPNYIYQLSEMPVRHRATPMVRTASGGMKPAATQQGLQYVIAKLRLRQAHALARGERVLVAVIDSGVDPEHPELEGTIVKEIDVTDDKDRRPHLHGTAMTGAIVSHSQLLGVAPGARVIAIRAFSPRSKSGASGTSFHLAQAIDRAVEEGARIINLSLAGPHDPYIEKAIAEAHARGIVLVAAAGNAGPRAPAMFPAAYPQVIAVTATDAFDRIYTGANRGSYVMISAPGVDVLVAAPRGAYSVTTGTSVAAAHITGVIALMLARNPMLDPEAVREALLQSARAPGEEGRDDEYGAGHADAYAAVMVAGPPIPRVPVASGDGGVPTQ